MTPVPRRPRLAARVRLKYDRHDDRHVLLSPEKGMVLNASSAAIAALCDGEHRIEDIVATLVDQHRGASAERVERDVVDFLARLAERGLLQDAP